MDQELFLPEFLESPYEVGGVNSHFADDETEAPNGNVLQIVNGRTEALSQRRRVLPGHGVPGVS